MCMKSYSSPTQLQVHFEAEHGENGTNNDTPPEQMSLNTEEAVSVCGNWFSLFIVSDQLDL